MKIAKARTLKWGTKLVPTELAKSSLNEYRDGIFLGMSSDGSFMRVVVNGTAVVKPYHQNYWEVAK